MHGCQWIRVSCVNFNLLSSAHNHPQLHFRLRAGSPPSMPIYNGWRHCYDTLKLAGDHKRGSSLFFRYVKSKNTVLERM